MTDAEIADELCDLLGLLPGVSIAWRRTGCPGFRIGLQIDDVRSLALLVHCNVHWNVRFGVEVAWHCSEPHDEPGCLRYDLRIPDRSSDEIYVVGQVLIDRLESRGLLTPDDAERRKRRWPPPGDRSPAS